MDDLSSRFLDAFVAIERRLRKALEADRHATFHDLLRRASARDRTVKRLQDHLRDLAELRNFLVHQYRSDQPIAVPSEASVALIEGILAELTRPVRLVDLFQRPVSTCARSDPIGAAVRRMHDGTFSQLPVYAGNELVGVLSSETVARWLADRLSGGQGILEEETVEEVLRHGDGAHSFALVDRRATVDDALSQFDDALHGGKVLVAVLITQNGRRTERPLGIVTAADQPRLRAAIQTGPSSTGARPDDET